jgi:succinate-semialdehyde dehydrogenase/glutarate-semialdehyde dehydrogenase
MARAAEVLRSREEDYARLMTEEMGKPITQSRSEIQKCAWVCDYYADNAERFLCEQQVKTDARESFVRFEPLGPVLAVMPWNFPFWQVFRFAAPTLMAGNVGLLKHAGNVPGSAEAIEQIFREAGFPSGVFAALLVNSEKVDGLIASPQVRAVSLTGSETAGAAVAAAAGKLIKKCVLELGGSDPFIVLADADVIKVAKQAVQARCINSGQSCIAAKRFIVEAAVIDQFEQAFVAELERLQVGDPMQHATDIGPLARFDLLESLHGQVTRSVGAGARLLVGGRRVERRGYFYHPTALTGVTPGMAVFDEETFGPVAAIVRADNPEHAVQLANRSSFGLAASIWTQDVDLAKRLAVDIEAGGVFINEIAKSDPRLPFGGIKKSGFGRELSDFGIREFVNIKTIRVA